MFDNYVADTDELIERHLQVDESCECPTTLGDKGDRIGFFVYLDGHIYADDDNEEDHWEILENIAYSVDRTFEDDDNDDYDHERPSNQKILEILDVQEVAFGNIIDMDKIIIDGEFYTNCNAGKVISAFEDEENKVSEAYELNMNEVTRVK